MALFQGTSMNIESLKFMQGSWEAERGTGISEETWTAPAGKSMLGVSRTLRDGRTSFTEFLMIEEKEGKLTMTICQKLGGPVITLNASKVTDSEVVWEPVNDPNKAIITYRLIDKELHATVAGSNDGKPYLLEFKFKRKS